MHYEILENGDLKVSVTLPEQAEIRRLRDEAHAAAPDGDNFGSNDMMYDLLTPLFDDGLEWIRPEWIGALTAAPILGILGDEVPIMAADTEWEFYSLAGAWEVDGVLITFKNPVEQAWAFMDYALRSPQEDLAEQGFVVFQSGEE